MAQIPSWLWLSAGIIVTVGSYYVQGPVTLFFYLGLLFILIGVAKLLTWFMTGKKSIKTGRAHTLAPQPKAQPIQQRYKKCVCGRFVRSTDSFCWGCGRRLR